MRTSQPDFAQKHLIYHANPRLDEKVDVYAMGNIMYRIMTGSAPRGKSIADRLFEVRHAVAQGQPPQLAESHLLSKDPNAKALRKALEMCYEADPRLRPSSTHIATFLQKALDLIQGPDALDNVKWPFDTPPVTRKDAMKTNPHPTLRKKDPTKK
jgi:serine/threonine protein kinase